MLRSQNMQVTLQYQSWIGYRHLLLNPTSFWKSVWFFSEVCIDYNILWAKLQLGPFSKIAPLELPSMYWPPNLQGTLLVSIKIDSDHFQLNRTSFRKMFIFVHFVHYRNQGTDFRLYEALFISTRVPLHHGTAFNRIWVKLWPYKACYNPVTSVCKISDTSSGFKTRCVWMPLTHIVNPSLINQNNQICD